ncbi:hypothetical protein S1OALGB6SA_948 [Olavius algarvensis spirochete endosymbiont]|nr:hypothetical protein S1OALGB6SA_948 [Olavius algarvensis spirochete endosymbiont]
MRRSGDLSRILNSWLYDERNNVRFIKGEDGSDLMQIRLPLGIEQYNLNGRPDGRKLENGDHLLEIYQRREKATKKAGGVLILSDEDFRALREESLLYYYRYLILFQLGYYRRVVRDTDHNLNICHLIDEYYQNDGREELLQYRPYIRRINAISNAMIYLAENREVKAIEALKRGITDIEGLSHIDTQIFEFEKSRSIRLLTDVIHQVQTIYVKAEKNAFKESLAEELGRAVAVEDYERAALIRDQLKHLK